MASQTAVLFGNSLVKKYLAFYGPGRYNEMQESAQSPWTHVTFHNIQIVYEDKLLDT
jgi:hypothetical protein